PPKRFARPRARGRRRGCPRTVRQRSPGPAPATVRRPWPGHRWLAASAPRPPRRAYGRRMVLAFGGPGSGIYRLLFALHILAIVVAFTPAAAHSLQLAQSKASPSRREMA